MLVVGQPDSPLVAEARTAGLPLQSVAMPNPFHLSAIRRLRALFRARGVRLVHTHSSVDSWAAGLAAKSLGLPVVRSRHVTIPVSRARALVYRLADRVITSGEAVKAVLVAAGVRADKIVAIAPGIDPTRFHRGVSGTAVRQELGLRGPAVGLVANLRGFEAPALCPFPIPE